MQKYWGASHKKIDYTQIDQTILREYKGNHPEVLNHWLKKSSSLFEVDLNYALSRKEKKHRIMTKIENFFGMSLSKKHYKLV